MEIFNPLCGELGLNPDSAPKTLAKSHLKDADQSMVLSSSDQKLYDSKHRVIPSYRAPLLDSSLIKGGIAGVNQWFPRPLIALLTASEQIRLLAALKTALMVTIQAESSWNPMIENVESKAFGLFQIMPMHKALYSSVRSNSSFENQLVNCCILWQGNIQRAMDLIRSKVPLSSQETQINGRLAIILSLVGVGLKWNKDSFLTSIKSMLAKTSPNLLSKNLQPGSVTYCELIASLMSTLMAHVIGYAFTYYTSHENNLAMRLASFLSATA